MPDSPLSTPRAVPDLEGALAVLREHGSRVSTTRRALLSALFAAPGPLSVEDLARAATPTLDVPSTYRNLERLEDVGLVRHVHLGHGPESMSCTPMANGSTPGASRAAPPSR